MQKILDKGILYPEISQKKNNVSRREMPSDYFPATNRQVY